MLIVFRKLNFGETTVLLGLNLLAEVVFIVDVYFWIDTARDWVRANFAEGYGLDRICMRAKKSTNFTSHIIAVKNLTIQIPWENQCLLMMKNKAIYWGSMEFLIGVHSFYCLNTFLFYWRPNTNWLISTWTNYELATIISSKFCMKHFIFVPLEAG